jgi:hypothetical protein
LNTWKLVFAQLTAHLPLADQLATLLTKARWKVGTGGMLSGWARFVLVCAGDHPGDKVAAAARDLVQTLREDGIQSYIDRQIKADVPVAISNKVTPAIVKPDLLILVGSKQ